MSDPLVGWFDNAGVRVGPRRILHEDRERGLTLFPEKEIPYVDHGAVSALDPPARQTLIARHLYQYLMFTVYLETKVINPGLAMLAHSEVDYPMTAKARLDALKIYCDEGYHALSNLDVVHQIEQATGVAALPYDFQPRLDALARTAHRFLPEQPHLAGLLQVVVFETVVTSILSDVPHDPTVFRVVRDVVADHARDEAYHHAFFVKFFRDLWAYLSPTQRISVANAIPHFIDDCLRPDLVSVRASLCSVGLAPSLASEVVADSYPPVAVRATIRNAARHTIRLCESVGAFDQPGARDQLHDLGLAQ